MESWVSFGSDTPFGAINKGDILSVASFSDAVLNGGVRVISIEHIIWEKPGVGVNHKICIWTENVDEDVLLKEIGVLS